MAGKDKKKAGKDKKKVGKEFLKQEEYCSFLYMLPVAVTAKELSEELGFIPKEVLEVWTEVNVLEISLENGTLTLEDMMSAMSGDEDAALLAKLEVKQVYACDYKAADKEEVQKIMQSLTGRFGGFLASDTEDFQPFIKVEEL